MRKSWGFDISGHGAEGATFHCVGTVLCELNQAMDYAMEDVFRQLTNGRAIYGSPGVGCRGPYTIQRVLIEEQTQ